MYVCTLVFFRLTIRYFMQMVFSRRVHYRVYDRIKVLLGRTKIFRSIKVRSIQPCKLRLSPSRGKEKSGNPTSYSPVQVRFLETCPSTWIIARVRNCRDFLVARVLLFAILRHRDWGLSKLPVWQINDSIYRNAFAICPWERDYMKRVWSAKLYRSRRS